MVLFACGHIEDYGIMFEGPQAARGASLQEVDKLSSSSSDAAQLEDVEDAGS